MTQDCVVFSDGTRAQSERVREHRVVKAQRRVLKAEHRMGEHRMGEHRVGEHRVEEHSTKWKGTA